MAIPANGEFAYRLPRVGDTRESTASFMFERLCSLDQWFLGNREVNRRVPVGDNPKGVGGSGGADEAGGGGADEEEEEEGETDGTRGSTDGGLYINTSSQSEKRGLS